VTSASSGIAPRAYTVIVGAAVVDAVFLVGLLIARAAGSDGAISVLVPLFAFGYIYLVYLTATGAMRRKWGWWFPGLVAITAGPAGAILGARRLRAGGEASARAAEGPAGPHTTRKEQRKAATERRRASGER
jgi:hypothetical protein